MLFSSLFPALGVGLRQPKILALATILALVASVPFFSAEPATLGCYFVRIPISTDSPATAQLFYDFGRGINEEDSARYPLQLGSGSKLAIFPIPSGNLCRIRLDPIDHRGKFKLGDAQIVDRNGQVVLKVPLTRLDPEHDIVREPNNASPSEIGFVATSDDPYLVATFDEPIALPAASEFLHRLVHALPAFLLVFAGILLVTSIIGAAETTKQVPYIEPQASAGARWFLGAGCVLALFKLWLVSGQTVYAIVNAQHDDQLFINLADSVLGGRWLGTYSQFTLMKGPMYSLFMAGVFLLGTPLFVAQHLLYIAACGIVVRSLRPFRVNLWVLFGLFVLLLFNPVTYDAGAHTRILRQHLLYSLALVIAAGGIGLYGRRQMPVRKLLPWALLSGVSLPAFWMTREDGVWIVPLLAILWGALGIALWRERLPAWRTRALVMSLPFFLWPAGIAIVSWLNYTYYGIYTTCEMKHPDFKAAYGALLRIEPQAWRRFVAVPREARERAYMVSPTFAKLRPYLEGSSNEIWATMSKGVTLLAPKEREICDGLFVWALRDAVFDSGNARNGNDAMTFYANMADEINAACDRGLIKAGPRRTGFLPPWRPAYTRLLPDVLKRAGLFFISFDDMSAAAQPSLGPPEGFTRFADLTRGRLTPPAGGPPVPHRQRWLDNIRIAILTQIQIGYHRAGVWLAAATMLAFLAAFGASVFRRRLPYFVILCGALLASCLGLVAICSLVDVTSFTAVFTMYFTAGYGLWLLFLVTSWLALAEALQPTTRSSVPSDKPIRPEPPIGRTNR